MAAQGALVLIVLCVPFGFDHPSRLGLDFDHFLAVLVLYAAALVGGAIAAGAGRRWGALALQLAVPCAVAGLVLSGALAV